MPRKQLDGGRLAAMGWRPTLSFMDALAATCAAVAAA
jgi:hypothetical protein